MDSGQSPLMTAVHQKTSSRSKRNRGEVLADLGSLSNLIRLHLGGNELGGCVPSSLAVMATRTLS